MPITTNAEISVKSRRWRLSQHEQVCGSVHTHGLDEDREIATHGRRELERQDCHRKCHHTTTKRCGASDQRAEYHRQGHVPIFFEEIIPQCTEHRAYHTRLRTAGPKDESGFWPVGVGRHVEPDQDNHEGWEEARNDRMLEGGDQQRKQIVSLSPNG